MTEESTTPGVKCLKGKFSANERGVKKKHFGTRNTAVAVEADYQLRIKCY